MRLTSLKAAHETIGRVIRIYNEQRQHNQLADSRQGLQFCYNLANLPSKVEGMSGSGNAGLTLSYGYLSDTTETAASLLGTMHDLWYIADHLGNTRAVVDMTFGGFVAESNEYLPFGTRLDGPLALPENRYRLGGKEEQRYGGLDNIGNIAFDYDIHGWTTGIEARNNWGQDLVFGEALRYASPQKPGTTARFDGNIKGLNRYGAAGLSEMLS